MRVCVGGGYVYLNTEPYLMQQDAHIIKGKLGQQQIQNPTSYLIRACKGWVEPDKNI